VLNSLRARLSRASLMLRSQQGSWSRTVTKRINLALQGGGAHGAFTWGVLDRLLQDERLKIDGISGTSAGAMNGAVLVYGMIRGGRQGARDLLREFSPAQIVELALTTALASAFSRAAIAWGPPDTMPLLEVPTPTRDRNV